MYTNILNIPKGFICHQVNLKGVMGAGLAYDLREKWPIIYTAYEKYYKQAKLGQIQPILIKKNLFVVNFFSQESYGRNRQHTDYSAFTTCLEKVKLFRDNKYSNLSIYFPYKIGCGLGGGNWSIIHKMIINIIPNAIIIKK